MVRLARNHSRLTSITYPSGYVVTHNYSSGINDTISRLSSLSDASGTVESYDYLGAGTVVRRGHPLSGVDQSFILKAPESFGDAGDQYNGLDRFGRIADQRWRTSSADVERTLYGYDRNGNRTSRTNTVNAAYSEVYTYDGLNQLATFNRNSGARTQSWDYDALGNWDSQTTNGSTQTRTHNRQNEILTVSGATSPTFDANGNMTTDETGKQYTYDAWNRLKVVKNSGGTTLKTYTYDALNRRVVETASGTTTEFYYSAQWQVLEEAVGGTTTQRYVWSPVYVDALILRDRDTDANGSLDERLWVMQDANWNVTGLVNASGTVVERYAYDPFGVVTVMNGSWTVGSTAYGWQYYHQGGRLDATSGLYHFRNREYSPTLGRWVSMDPIKYTGGDVNLYRALSNSPIYRIDPLGLADDKPLFPTPPKATKPVTTPTDSDKYFNQLFGDTGLYIIDKDCKQKVRDTYDLGCVGISLVALGGGNLTDKLGDCFSTFEAAARRAEEMVKNGECKKKTARVKGEESAPVLFAVRFFMNGKDEQYKPDLRTGRVDMSKWDPKKSKPGYINFDFGMYQPQTMLFLHANHCDPRYDSSYDKDKDKMIVKFSNMEGYFLPYDGFDNQVFCVACTDWQFGNQVEVRKK